MLKKFSNHFLELEFRAARAYAWCKYEGTELGEVVRGLYSMWDLRGIGSDEESEQIIRIMESFAFGYARENVVPQRWVSPEERNGILEALRVARAMIHSRWTGRTECATL